MFDVVIVGAGPAGSTAAYYSNKKTLIIDKYTFPRHKACGGGLVNSKDWPKEFENFSKIQINKFPTNEMVLYFDQKEIFKRKDKHLWDQVSRYDLDDKLLKQALNKKNVTFKKFNVKEIVKEKNYYVLSDNKTKIKTKFIIGADGWDSIVSEFLGNKQRTHKDYAMCMEYDLKCEKKTKIGHFFYFFQKQYGYGWIFPTKDGYYIGFGALGKTDNKLDEHLDELLAFGIKRGLIPKKYKIQNRFGAPDPLKLAKKYSKNNIILCGDALGTVNQLTGEGIYYALHSGKLAGQAINSEKPCKEFKKTIKPTLKEVTVSKIIPPKFITLNLFRLNFFILKLLPLSFREKIINRVTNNLSRRNHLIKNTYYKKF